MSLGSLEVEEVSVNEVQAELDRICESGGFSRSDRSQKFLRYVCDLTLKGEASRINQYLIGSEVFQRGAGYSTSEDSVVRRQAHVLRQKLIAYDAHEGRHDPIRIELPVGQYVPVFQRQVPDADPLPDPKPAVWLRFRSIALTALTAITLGFIGWVIGRNTADIRSPVSPVAREIWGPWLDDSAGLVATFFTKASVPVRATQSRLISWEDFRRQNFILLGHSQANAWIDPLLVGYPFRLGETDEQRFRYIEDTSPLEGEESKYEVEQPEGEDEPTQEYALISMIPGLDSKRKLLLINGLNTQATQVATELLTAPNSMEQLYARLQTEAPSHQGPWHLQAIIRTEVRDKVATTEPEIIAVRVF